MNFKKLLRGPFIYIILAIAAVWIGSALIGMNGYQQVDTEVGLKMLSSGKVSQATIVDTDQRVDLKLSTPDAKYGDKVQFYWVAPRGPEVVTAVNNATLTDGFNDDVPRENWILSTLGFMLPIILIGAFFWFMLSSMGGGGNRIMQFGKSKAKLVTKETPTVTFDDVAGVDEAVEELREIKDFLAEPAKFQAVGARIPKGVLLYGPPGTGKTLLARAVAGEAGVPFFSISGSDFVEMFVGVGASRVRDLFEQAKQAAPAIIFIDEIDAVGRHRGAGMGGGHDEREQTLNQMLSEMDGFDPTEGVVVMAATNRPDVLDAALLRPGRFDRQVVVPLPDLEERLPILQVHAKNKQLADDVNLETVARGTPGMSGADLANLVNEAALHAVRRDSTTIAMADFENARDRVVMGQLRDGQVLQDDERERVAYHESGHALLAYVLEHSDPLHKITILPRGMALGVTWTLPEEDRHIHSRQYVEDSLCMRMGGRVAELLIYGDLSTGASDDLQRNTELAGRMVREWGMSKRVGPMAWGSNNQVFLGEGLMQTRDYSDDTAKIIDEEVERILREQEARAIEVLTLHRRGLEAVAQKLLAEESIDGETAAQLIDEAHGQAVHPFGKKTVRTMLETTNHDALTAAAKLVEEPTPED